MEILGEKPLITVAKISEDIANIELEYNHCKIKYYEKNAIAEGYFKGYVIRFIYGDTVHLCHPKNLWSVQVFVDSYNDLIKQQKSDIELQKIIKLKKEIIQQSTDLHADLCLKDQELGDLQDLLHDISTDIKDIQNRYSLFDQDLVNLI